MSIHIHIRTPFSLSAKENNNNNNNNNTKDEREQRLAPPSIPFFTASPWTVTHSTLPLWKSKRNVRITYTTLPSTPAEEGEIPRLDDHVAYQTATGSSVKSVRGIDRAVRSTSTWAWKWRGAGWLAIASSEWEVLGFGRFGGEDGEECEWAVTYFARTLFTPAGIDVYARPRARVPEALLQRIKDGLRGIGKEELVRLAGELFLVQHD